MADLLDLGRRGRSEALSQAAQAARLRPGWTAATALELACAWLLAGDLRQADLAYLEADQLDRSLALVPDVWGLWPAPVLRAAPDGGPSSRDDGQARSPERQNALALAERYRSWRHPDPQALWQQLLPQLQADWHQALDPEVGDPLLILGRATAGPGARQLDPPLEPELVRLVADAEIAAEPAAANRYWQRLAAIRPGWDLARIRAADLALARGDLETSGRWLADPPTAALANPWFHDVAARQAVARGAVAAALDAWAEAIRAAQAAQDTAALAEIFEQRSREARRGPGVLQVRSLANRGEPSEALALLERLLADDPQWQPLRNLREQLQAAAKPAAPQSAANPLPAAAAAAADQPEPAAQSPDQPASQSAADSAATEASLSPSPAAVAAFDALLDRTTARLQALGLTAPAPAASAPANAAATAAVTAAGDLAGLAAELEALERRFSDYEARFALA